MNGILWDTSCCFWLQLQKKPAAAYCVSHIIHIDIKTDAQNGWLPRACVYVPPPLSYVVFFSFFSSLCVLRRVMLYNGTAWLYVGHLRPDETIQPDQLLSLQSPVAPTSSSLASDVRSILDPTNLSSVSLGGNPGLKDKNDVPITSTHTP